MEFFLAVTALGTLAVTLLSVLAGLAYTVWWFWMVLDSIVRNTCDYPAGVDKVIWVLLNAFLQPAFVLYYFLVYRKVGENAAQACPGSRAA